MSESSYTMLFAACTVTIVLGVLALVDLAVRGALYESFWLCCRRVLCWLGRHEYEWPPCDQRHRIRAAAIKGWPRPNTTLKCHWCLNTTGPSGVAAPSPRPAKGEQR